MFWFSDPWGWVPWHGGVATLDSSLDRPPGFDAFVFGIQVSVLNLGLPGMEALRGGNAVPNVRLVSCDNFVIGPGHQVLAAPSAEQLLQTLCV